MSLAKLRSASINFDDLAEQISNCAETRDKGGEIGWISSTEDDKANEHLDLILPKTSRVRVMEKTIKVGAIYHNLYGSILSLPHRFVSSLIRAVRI